MFEKILVAEDMSSINEGVSKVLKDAGASMIDHAQYCDKALLKLKRALKDDIPYDLLISDMSFREDYRKDQITGGEQLIELAKKAQPNLKVVAYSIEDKVAKVQRLFDNYDIDAYVCKDRNGLKELIEAINTCYKGERFASSRVAAALQDSVLDKEFSDYDEVILTLMSEGLPQAEIGQQLKRLNIKPHSKSAVEKRINQLKTIFDAKNSIHLVAIAKDLGII